MTSSLTGCLTHSNPSIITYLHTKVCSGLSHISHLWRSNGHGIILQNLHRCYKHCSVMQRLCIIPSKDHKFGITIEGCQSVACIWRHKSQCILEPWMGEYRTLILTGSQCNSFNTGVMWSCLGDLVTIRAAIFWIGCTYSVGCQADHTVTNYSNLTEM